MVVSRKAIQENKKKKRSWTGKFQENQKQWFWTGKHPRNSKKEWSWAGKHPRNSKSNGVEPKSIQKIEKEMVLSRKAYSFHCSRHIFLTFLNTSNNIFNCIFSINILFGWSANFSRTRIPTIICSFITPYV